MLLYTLHIRLFVWGFFLLQSTAAMAGITCYKAKSVITLHFCYDTVLNLQSLSKQLYCYFCY